MEFLPLFVCILMVFAFHIAVGVEGANYDEDCKADGDCKGTNATKCDSGTTKCICSDGFFRKTTPTVCATQIALNTICDTAQTASDQCSIANSECREDPGTDKCLCKPTHYETGGACLFKIALKAACTNGHPAGQCKDTFAECRDKSGFKCLCKTNNFEKKDVNCAAQVGLGGTCDTTDSATDQCSVADTECRDDGSGSKCLCKSTHYSDGTACVIKFAGLHTTCNGAVSTRDQCSAAETECRDDGAGIKCLCKATHYSDGTACQTKIALKAACTNGHPAGQCKDTLAECRDKSGFKCACKTNNFEKKDVTCAAQVGLDGTCDTTDSAKDQCSVADTECRTYGTGSKCLCKSTHYSDGSACVIKVGLDGTCDTTDSAKDQCSVADTECRDDGARSKCLCKSTHYSDGSACVIRIKPNIACTAAGQCDTHATCDTTDTDTCVCDASYTPSPIINPTMCSGVVKFSTQKYTYVVPILVSMMFLLR